MFVTKASKSKIFQRNFKKISAKEIFEDKDFHIIDVRSPKEYETCRLKNISNIPLPNLEENLKLLDKEKKYVMLCQSGMRSQKAAELLDKNDFKNVYSVEGGMNLVKSQIPSDQFLDGNPSKVWEMDRQVRFTAGSLVTTGILGYYLIHPSFLGLSGFVGVGLIYSAVSNTCAMGNVLAKMPWNKAKNIQACPTPKK